VVDRDSGGFWVTLGFRVTRESTHPQHEHFFVNMCKDDMVLDISCKGYLCGRVILFILKAVEIIGGASGLIQISGFSNK
jgi:hypothetical protein